MTRKKELEKIAVQIRRCKKCKLWKNRIHAVPGEGPANAKILLVGQAPGSEENRIGRPFVGIAGKKLNKLLADAGIDRKKCFITSPIKCFPPRNRKPKPDEIKACLPYLKKQIDIIKPRVIVLLGRVAAQVLLGKVKLNKVRGKKFLINKILYMATYHPAAARFPKIKRALTQDFKKLRKLAERIKL